MASGFTPPPAVELLLANIPYQFSEPRYFVEALRAAGSGYNLSSRPVPVDGHKRLAQVGGAVMKAAVLSDWYMSGTERCLQKRRRSHYITDSGTVVAARSVERVGSHEVLETCGRMIGLQDCISTNPGQGHEPPSQAVTAKAVQAMVGAIWIDSRESMQEVRHVLQILGLLNLPVEG